MQFSGGEISLEDLSASEMKAFQRAIAGGKFSHMIKPWEPWWAHPLAHTISLSKDGTPLVQLLQEEANRGALPVDLELVSPLDSETDAESSEIPAPPDKPLQSIKDLTPKQPSPLLGVHLIEVVYGYCFMLRLFNGDWESDPLDAALVLLDVARILGDGASPVSVGGALAECLETICSPALKHAGGYRSVHSFAPLSSLLCLLELFPDVLILWFINNGWLRTAFCSFAFIPKGFLKC